MSRRVPTFQPTRFIPFQLNRIDYVRNFVTGGLGLALATSLIAVFFVFGGIRKVAFFRHTRVTRPCARMFVQAYERMQALIDVRTPTLSVYRARQNQSAVRGLFFLVSSLFAFATAAVITFIYLTIGITFQAMLIYRTFPLNADPLVSTGNLLQFIRQWWATVIRYIIPPLYLPINYDTTLVYQPMVQAFDWLVNLRIDFRSYLANFGFVCQGAYVAPLELLLNVAIVIVLYLLVDVDYSVLLGPVMNGTYDKHLEVCFFRSRGFCGRAREMASVVICLLYRTLDIPQQFNNAAHFLSTLITYRVFFAGGDPSIVGQQANWRHQSSVVCDNVVFYNAGATKISNVDTGLAIVCTLMFFFLILLAVFYGARALYPQHDLKKPNNMQLEGPPDLLSTARNAAGLGWGPGPVPTGQRQGGPTGGGTSRSLFTDAGPPPSYPSGYPAGGYPGGILKRTDTFGTATFGREGSAFQTPRSRPGSAAGSPSSPGGTRRSRVNPEDALPMIRPASPGGTIAPMTFPRPPRLYIDPCWDALECVFRPFRWLYFLVAWDILMLKVGVGSVPVPLSLVASPQRFFFASLCISLSFCHSVSHSASPRLSRCS